VEAVGEGLVVEEDEEDGALVLQGPGRAWSRRERQHREQAAVLEAVLAACRDLALL